MALLARVCILFGPSLIGHCGTWGSTVKEGEHSTFWIEGTLLVFPFECNHMEAPEAAVHPSQPLFELEASSHWQEPVRRTLGPYSGDVAEQRGCDCAVKITRH